MRSVLVYTPGILPRSQTFVLDQARGLTRWSPTLVGRERVDAGLVVDDVLADEMRSGGSPNRLARASQRATRRVPLLRAAASRVRPDLIHAHFLTGGFDAVATIRPLPCPLVVTAHGFDATWHGRPPSTFHPEQWWHGLLRRQLLRQPVRFIAVSKFIAERLQSLGAPAETVFVHYTGVDTTYFEPPGGHGGTRRGVLFVGRLVEKKGVLDLLAAVARLSNEGLSVPVEIIGDGPLRGAVDRFVERERLEVTVHGYQPRSAVLHAMHRAAVQCNPSRMGRSGDREGFGMVLAEAQSTGLPVVATRSGGMVEAVDHGRTGLLVPERDVGALAEALRACLTAPDLHDRLSGAARPWVVRNFDLARQMAMLEDKYDEWSTVVQ